MTMCAITKQCINLSKVCIITWTTWTADSSKTSIKKQPTWDTPVSQSNQSAANMRPTHTHTPAVYTTITECQVSCCLRLQSPSTTSLPVLTSFHWCHVTALK